MLTAQFKVDEFTKEEWREYAASFPSNNIYQSWAYGDAHTKGLLSTLSRAILFDRGRAVVMAQFRIKRIPIIGAGVAYSHWGPLWHDEDNSPVAEESLGVFLDEVRNELCIKRGLHIWLEPRSTYSSERDARLAKVFSNRGFHHNPQIRRYRTIILDLSPELDILLAKMDGAWRKNLRRSQKEGLSVECSSSIESFDRFKKLYDEMLTKKTFVSGVKYDALRRTQCLSGPCERVIIWVARQKGEDIGASGFSALGNTMVHFLAATSPRAPIHSNSGYLLHWLGICKAKELGMRWHDLGGLTDLPDNGVDRFKRRMGGSYTVFPGRFEVKSSSWRARLLSFLEKLYRTTQRIHP